MTTRDLLLLLLRRWYVVLVCGALGLAVTASVLKQPGVFYARFEVVVLGPRNAVSPNEMESPDYSLSPLAGLLAQDVMAGQRPLPMGSSDTTLFGEGIRSGYRVRVPNTGSQFVPQFSRSVLDVEVVDPDEAVVSAEVERLQREIEAALDERQDEFRVIKSLRASVYSSPSDPVIQYVSGRRSRVAAAMLLLTGVGAVLVVCALEAGLHRIWGRRRRTSSVAAVDRRTETGSS